MAVSSGRFRTVLASLALLVVSLELASWAAVWLLERRWEPLQVISSRWGVDYIALAREMEDLYDRKTRYHPTRWYALPPDYRGAFVRTDPYGFRIDRAGVSADSAKIALFGGSTMFSTTTRQEGTIAHALSSRVREGAAQVMNYGIGGYSTSAELPTFLEALRIDPNIRHAVFYDGVNEVGRYLELIQDDPDDAYYAVVGYPFEKTLRVALNNEVSSPLAFYRPRMLVLADYVRSFVRKMIGQKRLAEGGPNADLQASARKIVDLYVANVRTIEAIARGHGVVPVFLWQPDIFLTKKKLTAREIDVRASRPESLAALTRAVHELVVKDERLKRFPFFDVSDAIDGLEGEHFFDYCHLSEEANEVIAARIAEILRDITPAGYWR